MKKILFILILLVKLSISYGQDFCSTTPTMNSLMRGIISNNGSSSISNYNYYIKIYVHIIRKNDGSGAHGVSNDIENSINILNQDFNCHGIFFVWDNNIDYIDNNQYYYNPGNVIFSINHHIDGIDIYLYGENVCYGGLASGIGDGGGLLLGGYLQSFPSLILASSHVISHEMGHLLGLYHTHHGTSSIESGEDTCPELVNGSNSLLCGDYIEDTPADPLLNFNVNPLTYQWLSYGARDSNGDYYQPDTRLIMSYTHPLCMTYFTRNQAERMRNTIYGIQSLRNALIAYSNPQIIGSTIINSTSTYSIDCFTNGAHVVWNINNPSFCLIPSNNSCTVTYSQGQQYDEAILTASIIYNGVVIKTMTKHISYIGVVEGSEVLCNSALYNIVALPDSLSVNWSIDNSSFSLNTFGNQCVVSCTNYSQTRQACLTAAISKNSNVLATLTKDIYTHGTALSISGTQEAYSSSLGYYPEQTFSYNVTNAGSGFSSSNIIVNADCDIVMESERFQGMEISFEGNGAPTNVQHNGSFISFHTRPYSNNYAQTRSISGGDDIKPSKPAFYPFTMQLRDGEGCSNFDLNFKVETLPFLNDSELQISTTSTTLYAHLMTAYATPIGGGLYQQPTWHLSVINSQTGQIMISKTVTGSDTTVNISSYSSGMYIVRAVHDGNTYSAKFIK